MSDANPNSINAISSSSSSGVTQAAAVTTDATTAAGAASSNRDPNQVKMSDTISNLAQLREKAPTVYDRMMMGIATNICNQMKRQQERLKQTIRQGNPR